ncbi:hypothetical protein SCARR_00007 [Pontiella sulfatireligans]|uniref:Uncharacterized protein n=1 Tax=Pontiella sulfatireligans TaxID=2750658 RepID=A0A6C2UEJ5_9BACT|nr:hypothetical protein SCARR_00007 [Pontiella sulfatireligans]
MIRFLIPDFKLLIFGSATASLTGKYTVRNTQHESRTTEKTA